MHPRVKCDTAASAASASAEAKRKQPNYTCVNYVLARVSACHFVRVWALIRLYRIEEWNIYEKYKYLQV